MPEASRFTDRELELQSSDTDNFPIIKERGILWWSSAANGGDGGWVKWDGTVQDRISLDTNVSSTLTLTNANEAYQITEPTSDFFVVFCNNSNADMFWGFATLTTGGILLPAAGGTIAIYCAANKSPFFYCGSAGKVLNYTTTII